MNENVSPTLAGRVLALMRSDILELRLEPGSKLLFEALREKYDVGLSPLRESLSRLVVEGLVVGEDRRGFRVAWRSRDRSSAAAITGKRTWCVPSTI